MAFRIKEKKSNSRTAIKDADKTSAEDAAQKRHDDIKGLRKEFAEERLQKKRGLVDVDDPYNIPVEQLNQALVDIGEFDQKIVEVDEQKLLEACRLIRRDTCDEKPESLQRIKPHVKRICQLMSFPKLKSELHFELAWIILNISIGGGSEFCHALVNFKACESLMKLALKTANPETKEEQHREAMLQEQCLWSVGNISGDDDPKVRQILIRANIIAPLVECCLPKRKPPLTTIRQVAWNLCNLFRYSSEYTIDIKDASPAFPCLIWMLKGSDHETRRDALLAFSGLLLDKTKEQSRIEALMNMQQKALFPLIAKALQDTDLEVAHAALFAIGNIVSGTDDQTTELLNQDSVLKTLASMLHHKESKFRKHACFALSNVAGGPVTHIHAMVREGVVPPILKVLRDDTARNKKEALWVIYNMCLNGDEKVLRHFAENKLVAVTSDLLKDKDPQVLSQTLEIYQMLLEPKAITEQVADQIEQCPGTLDQIEQLQEHHRIAISKRASNIISDHFGGEAGPDEFTKDSDQPGAYDAMTESVVLKF
jgi:HEAT repeat protein